MGSANDKPVFLVVTGAWHPPVCYDSLKNELNRLGYECAIPQMPSMGYGTHGVTWEADKAKVLETAEPYFDEGREVVLVGHSYGGIPATVATEGQGVHERAERGLKGGFRSIVFLAAFANKQSTINEKGFQMLYNDTTEEEARKVYANLLPHSQDAFETGIDFIATDITIPKTYIICENDLIFPLALQEQLVKLTPGMKERRIAAGHSPFLGKSPETCKILVEITEGQ
ncbi:AB hydrolase-1 domain-containing protein [Fusarium keratoplasticum]|nr:AB hydrolase-1 domain-containing protein [Fusarium keratoplasticum]